MYESNGDAHLFSNVKEQAKITGEERKQKLCSDCEIS